MNNLYNIEQLLADNPSSPTFVVLSDIYYKQGYYKESLNICKKGLKNDPNNQLAQYILAKLYLIYNQEKKAEKILKKIIQNDPYHLNATILLIEILIALNRSKTTINKYIVFANSLFPNHKIISKYLRLYDDCTDLNKNKKIQTSKIVKKVKKVKKSSKYHSHLATKTLYNLFLKQKKYFTALEVLMIMQEENQHKEFATIEIQKLHELIKKES